MKQPSEIRENLDDIQGNVLRGYRHPHAAYLFLRFPGLAEGRAWLGEMSQDGALTTAQIWADDPATGRPQKPPVTTNCALSFAGLTALGLGANRLGKFPAPFREGMHGRAALLGDTGDSDPSRWSSGLSDDHVHALVVINAESTARRDERVAALRLAADALGVTEAADRLLADAIADHKEHFGFRDGIGQPSIEGGFIDRPGMGKPEPGGAWRPIKPGEFLMGYEGERVVPPIAPEIAEFCLNGTYLVFRKLAQDVRAFRAFLAQAAMTAFGSDAPAEVERMAAKLMGRWRSGAPLPLAPEQDTGEPASDFRFGDDSDGSICPLGAHIRRTNPRDALDNQDVDVQLHRILRRGLPYGPAFDATPDAERGVAFLALNADIEIQFEFVQREWVNKGEFAGLLEDERDPIVGANENARFTVPGASELPFVFGLNRFVATRGGGYFLMPGVAALRKLSTAQP